MKMIFLFTLLFFITTSHKSFADDAGIVVKMKDKQLVAKITSDLVSLDSKYYYVVDSKNKKVAWLEIEKIQKQMALFKVLKGKADPGQKVTTLYSSNKKVSVKRFLRRSPWGAEYQLSMGSITSSPSTIKNSSTGNSFWARYVIPINKNAEVTLWGGLKISSAKITYADGTATTASDLSPLFSGRLNLILNSDWQAYLFSTFDRCFVNRVQSTTDASQAFIYKSANGLGAETRLKYGITARSDFALVLPNHSATNSIKSGFELAIGAEYDWQNIQFGYRGVYQKITTDTDSDSGMIHTLMIGYNF